MSNATGQLDMDKIDEDLMKIKNSAAKRVLRSTKDEPDVSADDDMAISEAIAQVEKELSSDEKKDETEGNSLADNVFFNIGFIVIVVAFWLKYFNVV